MIIGLKNLCQPAEFYLVVSVISLVLMLFQSSVSTLSNDVYCIGFYDCKLSSNTINIVFFIKIIYIAFWTWALNIICRTVSSSVAWFLAVLPIVLFFTIMWYGMYTRI